MTLTLNPYTSYFTPSDAPESAQISALIRQLKLLKHVEGGYFAETDRDVRIVPNPFLTESLEASEGATKTVNIEDDLTRSASTSIFYLLTPNSPYGAFHRNKGRTIHTLHKGRGRYVILHPPSSLEDGLQIETFIVGQNVEKGEQLQWVVDGGKWKTSFLLPDVDSAEPASASGLLISETVIPGFEYQDHDFLTLDNFKKLFQEPATVAEQLLWLVRKGSAPVSSELI